MTDTPQATHPLHMSKSAEHFTPQPWPNIAHAVMGGIDVDPASCALANENVHAATYFTAEDNGLDCDWHGRVFLNPPGNCGPGLPGCGNGKSCSCALVARFWEKLSHDLVEQVVTQAFWVGYSLHQLQTLQNTDYGGPLQLALSRGSICIPSKRVNYSGKSPTHPSFFAYFGPVEYSDCRRRVDLFDRLTASEGETLTQWRPA